MNTRTLAFVLALFVPCAGRAADHITPPPAPADIAPAAVYKPFLIGHAVGTQNYICAPSATGPKWLFIGPQATVFAPNGEQLLTHFQSENPMLADVIQATWQESRDSSAVWARKLVGSIDSAYVAPDAIEWLMLGVTAMKNGPAGGGKLTSALFIQRVNTVGGKEPAATACTETALNTRKLVHYEADYVFYK